MNDAFYVRLRETGAKRHEYLGRNALTMSWMHAVHFDTQEKAREAGRWMLRTNADSLDSCQVVYGFRGRVAETFTAADLAREAAEAAPQLRLDCDQQMEMTI